MNKNDKFGTIPVSEEEISLVKPYIEREEAAKAGINHASKELRQANKGIWEAFGQLLDLEMEGFEYTYNPVNKVVSWRKT